MKHIIIFDMDGVLVDSQPAHAEAFNLAFEKNNLKRVSEHRLINLFGPPAEEVVKSIYPKISKRKLDSVVEAKQKLLLEKAWKKTKSIGGVASALFELKKKYTLALVTNAEHSEIFQLLKAGGIDARLFDATIGANDIPKPKPDPAVVKKVEDLLKGKVKCVVGDRTEDVELAKNAGVTAIAVDSGSEDLDDLSDAGASIIVKSAALLPEVLM